MHTPSSEASLDPVRQVCTSCKKRKRKCDKTLPCSPCAKKNLTCTYLREGQTSASTADRSWYGLPAAGDPLKAQSLDFPTVLFLDPGLLQHGQVDFSQATAPIPAQIPQLLGDMDGIQATASQYFEHVHLWMPFISKKRFYELYLLPSYQLQPDIVLLLLALKLITTLPPTNPRNPRTQLYYAAKHYHLELEVSSIFSLPILQAGVLLALYELGHGIYPAAYLTIGACARYAHALGINARRTLNARKALTLVEAEERRRVWWAIIILDRFVSIGCPGRPFATEDPSLDDLLPADDAAWDKGVVGPGDVCTLSSPMTDHMNKFALLCQAARLLGQVLIHISGDSAAHDDVRIQLDRTLQSMLTAALQVDEPDNDKISFVYSSLIALYTPWLSPDGACIVDTDRSQRARAIIEQITERIRTNLVDKRCFLGRSPEDLSPWGLFFAYHIRAAHVRFSREKEPDSTYIKLAKTLKETFQAIDVRWNVAGVYLQLFEAQEILNAP